ncbi:MAG TPA: glycosyltransferase family 9 protein [Chloroflexota bacterium]|nr:glycosyltransferase family 9 protein [Chloroflexota bacterium]
MMTLEERLMVQRLAIVRALHVGDLLLAVPAFRAIRRGFPAAEITLIGLPWARDFVQRFRQYVDRLREFPGYPGLLEVDEDRERIRAFLDQERAYRYDVVVQMHGNGRASNPFALELGGRRTIGYYESRQPDGLWLGATYPDDRHESERDLGLAGLLGLPADDLRLEFPLLPEDVRAGQSLLSSALDQNRPVVGLHVGARPPARRWPAERFAIVGDALACERGAQVVITAGPGEEPLAQSVVDRMDRPPLNLAGRTSLGSLAAVIHRCDLFISNDTGPAHVAVALDTPSITIFGPADRRRWAPLDQRRHLIAFQPVACSPCPHWDCPIDHRCLRRVEPAQVLGLAYHLLAEESLLLTKKHDQDLSFSARSALKLRSW